MSPLRLPLRFVPLPLLAAAVFTFFAWAPRGAADAGRASSSVTVSSWISDRATPGGFATWSFLIENRSPSAEDVTVELELPETWSAVTPRRVLSLGPGESAGVPFTVWVPARASADSLYEVNAVVLSADGVGKVTATKTIRVEEVREVGLTPAAPLVGGSPGEWVIHTFTIENAGNVTSRVALSFESTPDWRIDPPDSPVELLPGERRDLHVGLEVPREAAEGTIHILTMIADPAEYDAAGGGVFSVRRRVSTLVEGGPSGGTYRRLPVRSTFSVLQSEGEDPAFGFRGVVAGALSDDSRIEMDLDLVSGDRGSGARDWRSQYLRVGYLRDRWELVAGDVNAPFPNVAYRVLSGRGIRFRSDGDRWTSRALLSRDRAAGAHSAWAAGVGRRVGRSWWVGADWIHRDLLFAPDDEIRPRRMGVLSAVYEPHPGFSLRAEGALGRAPVEGGGSESGRAALLEIERQGERWTADTRLYAGTSGNPGWTRDRDGAVLYLRYRPVASLALWTSADGSRGRSGDNADSDDRVTARYRMGARLTPRSGPRLELSAGGRRDREGEEGSVRDAERRDLSGGIWWPLGRLLFGLSGKRGDAFDLRSGQSGELSEYGATLGGSIRSLRAAFRWNRGREWVPESASETRSVTWVTDLGWNTTGGRAAVGLAAMGESFEQSLSGTEPWTRHTFRPRVDLRLFAGLHLRTESSIVGGMDDWTVERWQVNLTWSEANGLPVLWSPERGGLRALVFLDADGDGRRDPGEEALAGVVLAVDGEQAITGSDGAASWSSLEAGEHDVDLNDATLPSGTVALADFPSLVWIEAGRRTDLAVPVRRAARVSGRLFVDANGDGVWDPGEESFRDIRIELCAGETRRASGLTGAGGAYGFQAVSPGLYTIRVAEGWLPEGWRLTGFPPDAFAVGAGEDVELPPLGAAPRRRPIVMTYGGGACDGETAASPALREIAPVGMDTDAPDDRPILKTYDGASGRALERGVPLNR
ncbi:MAG: hypothetical protein JW958_02205 [Candidatus Eisenbacteria bacterium]|nr:hypothetical protein [Candidatus Eisenbacteria bacterium]